MSSGCHNTKVILESLYYQAYYFHILYISKLTLQAFIF